MNCHAVAAALVDDPRHLPPGGREHLEGCAACRDIARLHAAAQSLRVPEPPLPAVFSPEAIAGVVRRRQRRRRWAAGTGAAAAVALLTLLVSTPRSVDSTGDADALPVGGPLENTLQVAEQTPEPSRPAFSLTELREAVAGYSRTHPSVEDEAYRAFGPLAHWVRPPDSRALEAEPFHTALVAVRLP